MRHKLPINVGLRFDLVFKYIKLEQPSSIKCSTKPEEDVNPTFPLPIAVFSGVNTAFGSASTYSPTNIMDNIMHDDEDFPTQ